MKRLLLTAASLGLALTATAQSFTDYARVRSVEPQYQTIQVPRQECQWSGYQDAAPAAPVNYAGLAIGAVAVLTLILTGSVALGYLEGQLKTR